MNASGHAPHFLSSAALQNVVEVVFVPEAVLPRHLALAASGFAGTLEIKIEVDAGARRPRGYCGRISQNTRRLFVPTDARVIRP